MKKLLAFIFALIPLPALALQASSPPAKFPLCWGQNAGSSYIRAIPTPSQIGIQAGAASLNDGFPPLTFTPIAAGGVPPFGQDMNGILNQTTCIAQWHQAGGQWIYDSSFSSSVGGYPKNAILSATNAGNFWLNTSDNNSTNPDSGGSNWLGFSPIYPYAVDSGSANAGAITLPITISSLSTIQGRLMTVKKISSANTGAYTLAVNSFSASVRHIDGTALNSGDLPASGAFTVIYDGTNFDLQSPIQAAVFGTAATKNATNNADSTLASITGSITNTHVPLFADNFGSLKDNGNQLSNGSNVYLSTNPGSQTTNAVPLFADGNGSLKGSGALLSSSSSFVVTSPGSLTIGDLPKFNDANGTLADSNVKAGSVALDWISFNAPSGSLSTLVRSSTAISIVRNSTGVFTITETGTHSNIIAIGQGSLNTSLNNSQLIMNANNSSCSTSCTIQIAFSQPSEGSTMTPTDPPTNAMVVIYGQ